jgi:uncharacterized coiled-coil protein SlyX
LKKEETERINSFVAEMEREMEKVQMSQMKELIKEANAIRNRNVEY